jgi:exonuclease V gamma subunit
MLKTIQVCEYVCRPETMKTVKNNTFTVPYASLNRKFLKTKTHLSNRLQLPHVLIIIGTRSLDISQYFEVHVHVHTVYMYCKHVLMLYFKLILKNRQF